MTELEKTIERTVYEIFKNNDNNVITSESIAKEFVRKDNGELISKSPLETDLKDNGYLEQTGVSGATNKPTQKGIDEGLFKEALRVEIDGNQFLSSRKNRQGRRKKEEVIDEITVRIPLKEIQMKVGDTLLDLLIRANNSFDYVYTYKGIYKAVKLLLTYERKSKPEIIPKWKKDEEND